MRSRLYSLVTPFAGVLLLVVMLSGNPALAVTLGQAKVLSYLNQPLDVEIPLIGLAPGQHEELRLRLADQAVFDRLGVNYTRLLASMEFAIVQDDGNWVVRATTSRPVNEPFLDFPLLMAWPGGQLIRQYTLLLDPPGRPAPVVKTASVTRTATPVRRPTPPPAAAAAGTVYGPVQRGETLWPIAKKLKPSGITTRQMAMALLRAYPQAFIDGNVNQLRAGARLTIPTRSFIEEMDAATARREFSEQVRRWRAPVATSPRTVEPATPAVTSPAPTTRPAEDGAGSETPPVAETTTPTAARPTEDDVQLRIVGEKGKEKIDEGSDQAIKEQLLVTMEEVESNRITTDAIEARLERMESELDRLQKLVELKDAQILALQSEVSAQEAIRAAAREAEPAPPEPVRPAVPEAVDEAAKTGIAAPQVAAVEQPANDGITTRIEATPPVPVKPLHEQYAWLAWVLLGLAGLSALILVFRRSEQEDAIATLPTAEQALDAYQATTEPTTPSQPQMRAAASDMHRAQASAAREAAVAEESIELPPLDDTDPELDVESIMDQLAEERAQESAKATGSNRSAAADRPARQAPPPEAAPAFDDDDLASWVAELDAGSSRAATNNQGSLEDDDLPSILTELDDQLKNAREPAPSTQSKLNLDPLEDTIPVDQLSEAADLSLDEPLAREQLDDDTFTMSLDLARAYLEIGDQDGARDMLHQALAVAEDPDQREKIETLLRQIG